MINQNASSGARSVGQPSCGGWPGEAPACPWLCSCPGPQKEIEISARTNATPERNPQIWGGSQCATAEPGKNKRILAQLRILDVGAEGGWGQAGLREGLRMAPCSSSAALRSKG